MAALASWIQSVFTKWCSQNGLVLLQEHYKELHCGMCSPPKCAYLLQCQLLLWKQKQMFLPILDGFMQEEAWRNSLLEQAFPIYFDCCFDTGHPSVPCASSCLAPAGDFGHFSDPIKDICSRNGTWISCALTKGPSASSWSIFKNNNLLQSFPPHNISSKCSPFLMYLIPCSVANDHSRTLLPPCKVAFKLFWFFLIQYCLLSFSLALSTV